MPNWAITLVVTLLVLLVGLPLILKFLIGPRFIANTEVGIVEKTWGGGHLSGHIIALNNEAGFQPELKVLRVVEHVGGDELWSWHLF